MLIDAVPVRFVTVPLLGVPKAPLNVTKAPAEPTLTPKAVATPVPRPDTPVLIGKPVALVKTAAEGVPKLGVVSIGLVAKTLLPEPVFVTLTICLLALRASAVEAVKPDSVVVDEAVNVVNAASEDVSVVPLNVNADPIIN